jgi:hypothetical protein
MSSHPAPSLPVHDAKPEVHDFSVDTLVGCVEREIAYRERCYPRWVEEGRVPKQKADDELAMMKGVLRALKARYPIEAFQIAVKPFLAVSKEIQPIYDALVMANVPNQFAWMLGSYFANMKLSVHAWEMLAKAAEGIGARSEEDARDIEGHRSLKRAVESNPKAAAKTSSRSAPRPKGATAKRRVAKPRR